ncbi:MAG: DoxX family protein [Rickettsiaceae bacterium]|jgi:putative oxidoreductase|nr:DoxX family protein [Rickettsiaceae bacterium]
MMQWINKIQNNSLGRIYLIATQFSNKYLFSLLILFIRIWMARIFWYSGLTKISSWQTTLYLFQYEYKVPIIPIEIAASLAMVTELTMPFFLVIGFLTRFAAIPLICMVAVIQFTYLDLIEHLYWAILLATIVFYGPGRYSIDSLLCGEWSKK